MDFSRYRIRFSKRGALRFISHHDLMRVFELALRRSDLKVRYTEGFNPHPKVSFALALPLGVESLDEIVDIDILHEDAAPAPEDVVRRLGKEMPQGLELTDAGIATGRPQVAAVEYECELPSDKEGLAQVRDRLESFLDSTEFPFSRSRGKKKPPRRFDARAYTLDARLEGPVLKMRLAMGQQGGMKPTDLLTILQLDPDRLLVTKTRTILAAESPGNNTSENDGTQDPHERR